MIDNFFPNVDWAKMWEATLETIYMTAISTLLTFVIGLALGVLLFLSGPNQLWANKIINTVSNAFVNIFRSIPFIILIILLIPVTKLLFGSVRGPNAALLALIIGAAPFYARMVLIALQEIDKGVIEAAKSMGAKTTTIIYKVLLPESMPALISGITVTSIALVGYTAMAGIIGAGGLGTLAYMDGFQRSREDVTMVSTILVLIIVFVVQFFGDLVVRKLDKR